MQIIEENGKLKMVGTPEELEEARRRCNTAGEMDNRANAKFIHTFRRQY